PRREPAIAPTGPPSTIPAVAPKPPPALEYPLLSNNSPAPSPPRSPAPPSARFDMPATLPATPVIQLPTPVPASMLEEDRLVSALLMPIPMLLPPNMLNKLEALPIMPPPAPAALATPAGPAPIKRPCNPVMTG